MEASADDVYQLKRITFQGRPVQIVLQNLNGPCPLLAITNVLLLAGKLSLHADRNHVSYRHLVEMLGELLFTEQHVESEAQQLSRQSTISDTLGLLQRLCHGLDVNVGFDGTEAFEYTAELACFDAFGVTLRHGWLVDPQAVDTVAAVGGKTYNSLQEMLINAAVLREQRTPRPEPEPEPERVPTPPPAEAPEVDEADEAAAAIALSMGDGSVEASLEPPPPPPEPEAARPAQPAAAEPETAEPETAAEPEAPPALTPEQVAANEKLLLDAARVEEFLESSRTQLSYHGLFELMRAVKPNSLCAFFRNCHFGVMHNYEGKLYVLLTDAGYGDIDTAIWEELCEVDGDNVIVGCDFGVESHAEPAVAPVSVPTPLAGTVLPPGAHAAGAVITGTVLPPVVATVLPPQGGQQQQRQQMYNCDYGCGFAGSHADVSAHEQRCPMNPSAQQDYVVDSSDYVVQPEQDPGHHPHHGADAGHRGGAGPNLAPGTHSSHGPGQELDRQRCQEDTDGDLALALQMQEEETNAMQNAEREARERENDRFERQRAAGIREAMDAASALGKADKAMPPGTRVRVEGRGDGTVEGFEGNWLGANEFVIKFDAEAIPTSNKLRDLQWDVIGSA